MLSSFSQYMLMVYRPLWHDVCDSSLAYTHFYDDMYNHYNHAIIESMVNIMILGMHWYKWVYPKGNYVHMPQLHSTWKNLGVLLCMIKPLAIEIVKLHS